MISIPKIWKSERLTKFFRKHFEDKKQQLAETLAFLFVVVGSFLTYSFAVFLVLPAILSDNSSIALFIGRLISTWLLFGVISNMYLVRKRTSSIRRNRILMQPMVKQMSTDMSSMDPNVQIRETIKHMGEHSTPNPFGEGHNWHICGACECFVPPRAWHCYVCNTCILRRDHHCVFTGCCIGEENQSNFLGLLFYLGIGTTLSAIFSFIYAIYWLEMGVLWYIFRCYAMVYSIFFDFQVTQIMASVNTVGLMAAWGVFAFYIYISLQGQTSADAHRKINRTLFGQKRFSYQNMREFLGPKPILRILWPFHPPLKINYTPDVPSQDDDRKGL